MFKTSASGLLFAACVTSVALLAPRAVRAQNPQIQPNLQPNLQLRVAPQLPIAVSPQLQQYLLATKPKIAPAVLDQKFVLRGKIPFIKLENGQEKALIPLELMEGGPVGGNTLESELADYRSYILNKNLSNVARKNIFKINPKLTLAIGVDRRAQMTPIKDQGGRGTCVAHAANAALEVFASVPNDLSEQYSYDLFMRKESRQPCDDGGLKTTNSAIYLADGTVAEDKWAYMSSVPPCNMTVPAAASSATKYKIKSYQMIEDGGAEGVASIKNPRYLESVLNKGHNIVLGTHVAWGSANADGILDVVIDSNTNQPAASRGGHAMLICGYNAPKRYFIVKNSWGAGWGNAGYAYLSYDYMRTYAKYGYYIKEVEPKLILVPGVLNNPVIKNPVIINPGVINPPVVNPPIVNPRIPQPR